MFFSKALSTVGSGNSFSEANEDTPSSDKQMASSSTKSNPPLRTPIELWKED